MIPTLANVCSLPAPLERDIPDYAAGQCRSLEVWFTKLENYLAAHSVSQLQELLAREEVRLAAASFQGGLLSSQGERRREAWNLLERRLDLCAQLGVPTVVVAADGADPLDEPMLGRLRVSLQQLAQACARCGVRAALEFQSRATFANNLQTAAALVHELGNAHVGLCFDAFHFYTGPSKTEDLGCLTRENLFHVQLCDLADVPRELATDADRILPGDGDIPLAPLVARLREIEYAGAVSIEVMNPSLWQIPPRQFGEVALTALRKLLGLTG